MSIEARLRELGIDLPDIPPPITDGYVPKFAPWVRSGGHIFLSGRLAKTDDQLLVGKVGADIGPGAARAAARDVAIELLGVLKAAVGDLDQVSQVARMLVMVNGARGFNEPHRIADGASELLVEVFGERGLHARSALVAADLPFGAALEIDLVVEVAARGSASSAARGRNPRWWWPPSLARWRPSSGRSDNRTSRRRSERLA